MSKRKLMNIDDMFGDDENCKLAVIEIDVNNLKPFHDHPFKLYEGERLSEMIQSIKDFGVITPIVVQPINEYTYEILSGHNRVIAAKQAGLTKVPALVKVGLTENESILIVTETNTMQRSFSDLTHSERATIIATRHKAMANQGIRNDLLKDIEMLSNSKEIYKDTFSPMGKKCRTHDVIGQTYNLSKNSIARYLRISKLKEGLKPFVDNEKLSIRSAVDLSYLSKREQERLAIILKEHEVKVDMKTANELRNQSQNRTLCDEKILDIVLGKTHELTAKSKYTGFKLKPLLIEKYFSHEVEMDEIEDVVDKALNMYFEKIKY